MQEYQRPDKTIFHKVLTAETDERLAALVKKVTEEETKKGNTLKREWPRVGRNEPCPCGSGRKFKKCHLLLAQSS